MIIINTSKIIFSDKKIPKVIVLSLWKTSILRKYFANKMEWDKLFICIRNILSKKVARLKSKLTKQVVWVSD